MLVCCRQRILRDLLVNGEVKETIEAFGLGLGNRECVCHPLSDRICVPVVKLEGDRHI